MRIPDFKGLADYIHSLGLKFGIYSYRDRQHVVITWQLSA